MKRLSVKVVAQLAGLTTHTLRAWERRYSVISPSRSENGRREYSMEDVKKLKLLAELTENGHSISSLSKSSLSELESLLKVTSKAASPAEDPWLKSVISTLRKFDLEELDRIITRSRIELPVRDFVLRLIGPLMAHVGELVLKGKLDISQEHALSALLRNHLGEILVSVQKANQWTTNDDQMPKFLFSTPEGDLHEFGILLAAILAGSHGFRFRYLGPNTPVQSLADATKMIGAEIIVLGSVRAHTSKTDSLKKYVDHLSKGLAKKGLKSVSIWIGGYCDFDPMLSRFECEVSHLLSLKDFESKLRRYK